MKSSELRLENFVSYKGKIMAVHHLMRDACFLRYIFGEKKGALVYVYFTSIAPILLGDTMALGLGFEKSVSLDGDEIMQLPGTNFYIEWMDFADKSENGFYYYCESLSNHKLIKSVHQLQNLCFSLLDIEFKLVSSLLVT